MVGMGFRHGSPSVYWYADHTDLLQGNGRHALTSEDKLAMHSCNPTVFSFPDVIE